MSPTPTGQISGQPSNDDIHSSRLHGDERFALPAWVDRRRLNTADIERAYRWLQFYAHSDSRIDGAAECILLFKQQADRVANLKRELADAKQDVADWIAVVVEGKRSAPTSAQIRSEQAKQFRRLDRLAEINYIAYERALAAMSPFDVDAYITEST